MVDEQKENGSGDIMNGIEKDLFQRSMARETQALTDCLSLPPISAGVVELQKYAGIAKSRIDETKAVKEMSPFECNNLLGEMSGEDRKWAFANTLLRIATETKYLQVLENVGVTSDALAMGLDKGKYKAKLRFFESSANVLTDKKILGSYRQATNSILINDRVPYDEEMWKMMATKGLLPNSVGTVIHELTHVAQANWLDKYSLVLTSISVSSVIMIAALKAEQNLVYSIAQLAVSAVFLKNALEKRDGALTELDAFREENNFPGYYNESLDEPDQVAQNVKYVYGYGGERPFSVLTRAYDNMVVLREMGMTQTKLGKLVRGATYDPKSESYPKLEAEVTLKIGKWGVSGEDNVETFRRGLVARNGVETMYQRAMAMKIAGQEMRRERGREKWPYKK